MTTSSARSSSSSTMVCPGKLVTRELSNMSIEAYHGGKAVSVPFEWESEPGTPKFKSGDPSLPPLTPPPSYYCNKISMSSKKRKPMKIPNSSKPNNILHALFVKRATRKQPVLPSPPSSSSSSSVSSPAYFLVPSSLMIYSQKSKEEEDLYDVDHNKSSGWRGGCSFMIKKVLTRDFL